jgi:manganese/zinc/iron transport system permease protein
MNSFLQFFAEPWQIDAEGFFWIYVMGALVTGTCGVLGCYLNLRRNAMMGDAISHAVLPGILIGALLFERVVGPHIVIAAALSAMVCVVLVHFIYSYTRVKHDAAIGIAFTTMFALGVIGVSLYAGQIDLDAECVLYGEIEYIPLEPFAAIFGYELVPESVFLMGCVAVLVLGVIIAFYKELLLTSFDAGMAATLGVSPLLVHYVLMILTAMTAVSAFNAVGAILVVAMLVLPGATAYLLTDRLYLMLLYSIIQAFIYPFLGISAAFKFSISTSGAMVVVAFAGFLLIWLIAPRHGLLAGWINRQRGLDLELPEEFRTEEPAA